MKSATETADGDEEAMSSENWLQNNCDPEAHELFGEAYNEESLRSFN